MDHRELTELGVLGVVAEGAADVETIRERLQHVFGRYWSVSYGAIGPTVSRLLEAGYLAKGEDDRYVATQAGRDRLAALLREPVEDVADPTQQPQFVVKLGFLHHLPPAERSDELAALEDRFVRARERFADARTAHDEAVDEPVGVRRDLQELTIRLLDVQLEWLRELPRD